MGTSERDEQSMHVGFVVYDGLDAVSGGYRYDRKLVEHLETRGDTVDIIDIPQRSYPRNLGDGFSRWLRRWLDRPFDVLLQDELCHQSLFFQNRRLTEPMTIISLVHLLRSADPDRFLSGVYRNVERRYLDSVDAAICTSEYTERETTALSALPSMVAYPGGRADGTPQTQSRPNDGAGPLENLFVGNVIRRKGTLTLVDALSRLDGEWSATIIGDQRVQPAYAETVRTRIEAAGLSDRISMPGRVEEGAVDAALARADVLAVPSRYEGFGMVYLEAMEHGTIPIAGDLGGAGEFITHNQNGFLVGPDDTDALAAILRRLCSDPDSLAELSAAAVDTAAAHPNWADSFDRAREFMLMQAGLEE